MAQNVLWSLLLAKVERNRLTESRGRETIASMDAPLTCSKCHKAQRERGSFCNVCYERTQGYREKGGAKKHISTCGLCWTPGHNRKTCNVLPQDIECVKRENMHILAKLRESAEAVK